MNSLLLPADASESLSDAARRRLLAVRGEPLFYSDWLRAVFIHYEVPAELLQPAVPFRLDLRDGNAYVSVVAFTMRGLRLRCGGPLATWLFRPIATHGLLNVRTYVRHRGEAGIYFLSEWIPNRLSEWVGPRTFGLPYRHGRLDYEHHPEQGVLNGKVYAGSAGLVYSAVINPEIEFRPCTPTPGSLDEFVLERYTAFTCCNKRRKFFRIWHFPWLKTPIGVQIQEDSLLASHFSWFQAAKLVDAHYCPGVEQVWMGRPQLVRD